MLVCSNQISKIIRNSFICSLLIENNGFRATFLGFYVYVSNTTNRNEGHICFHDNGYFNISTIPPVLTLNCSLHGKYVIYYNERISGQPSYYSPFSEINLCEFEIYGKTFKFFSVFYNIMHTWTSQNYFFSSEIEHRHWQK